MDTITENIKTYLERVWGYKDKTILSNSNEDDRSLLAQLQNLQSNYLEYYHIQEGERLTVVWRKKDWDLEYQKWLQDKDKSEKRITEWNEQKANILYMTECIVKFDEAFADLAPTLAKKIVEEKNKPGALMFNASLKRLKWD